MNLKGYTFGDRFKFVYEARKETYNRYVEVSTRVENLNIAQKLLQSRQLCWLAGRGGV